MAIHPLPPNPSLKSLKNQAKQLLHAHRAGKKEACERIKVSHPRLDDLSVEAIKLTEFALADAQLVVAREYDFESWPMMTDTLFVPEKHFANEPGWEWILSPDLDHPIGNSGSTAGNGCAMHYENRIENSALFIYFAVGARLSLIKRDCRPVALDEEGKRHELKLSGSSSSSSSKEEEDIALYGYRLPYGEVPHNVIRYLGIEARKA